MYLSGSLVSESFFPQSIIPKQSSQVFLTLPFDYGTGTIRAGETTSTWISRNSSSQTSYNLWVRAWWVQVNSSGKWRNLWKSASWGTTELLEVCTSCIFRECTTNPCHLLCWVFLHGTFFQLHYGISLTHSAIICRVVPTMASVRVNALGETGKIKPRHKLVFGTGDFWQAPTLTANMGFVRAVHQTGMALAIIQHRPCALMGR